MLVLHVLPVSPATYQWSSFHNAAFLLRHSVVDLQDFLRPLCLVCGMRTQSYLWFSQNICTVCLSTQTKLFQKACSPANCSLVICFVRRYKYIEILCSLTLKAIETQRKSYNEIWGFLEKLFTLNLVVKSFLT